jgi:hypothetical protein
LVNGLLDRNLVKLDSPFQVTAKGKLTKEGRLDPASFEWGPINSADPRMAEVVKEAVEALNDSGFLQYLKDISGKDFGLLLQQDDLNITGVIQSDMESPNRANTIKNGLDLLIGLIKQRKSGENADQNDKDDLVLLENAKIETDGKRVQIRFVIPKSIAHPMIQRKLAEEKANPSTPAGPTPKPNDNTGKK